MREEDKNKGEGKGFAGISSLVSAIDMSLPPADIEGVAGSGASSNAERPTASAHAHHASQISQDQPNPAPSQPSSGASAVKWLLGIAAVIGVFWLIGQGSKQPSSPAPAYSPAPQTTTQSYSPPTQPRAPSRQKESRPPVGQALVLSTAQIRYCLAENIRLEGAKAAVNNHIDSEVDRFNALVADYNSRCGRFRYRKDDLESARRDIEPYRSELQAEGSSTFVRSTSSGSLAEPTPSRPAPDATVQAIQQKLKELGYSAGPPDGLMGRGTRAAIIAFQQDRGLATTGAADQALLIQLEASPTAHNIEGWNTSTTPTPDTNNPKPRVPANAWVSGSQWYCNDGYRRVGDNCERLNVPSNAWVSGSQWYCNDGYRRVGDICERLNVPANAWASGSQWYCNDGYRRVGDSCERLNVPANAWVSDSQWYCNDGYRRVGDKCVSTFTQ